MNEWNESEAYERGSEQGAERTFGALPPAQGRGFARTWWGLAWMKALEDTALDGQQLKKGRKYAREGAVGAVTVRPGRITAVVRERDGSAYRGDVLLQELSAEEWDRFLDMAVDRSGHIAALLDRDMPPHLVEDAAAAGVELLPGMGDLEPQCSCEAWDHCPHTTALCYQVARLLDEDPFILLLMRGRGERGLLDELQVRSATRAAPQEPRGAREDERAPEGVRADEVYAAWSAPVAPPSPPPLPDEPGQPPVLDTETGPAPGVGAPGNDVPGVDVPALEFLARETAVLARRMLTEALSAGHEQHPVEEELTARQDAVRLAASGPEPRIVARLAAGTGRDRAELALAVRAWGYGGCAALAVLEEEWSPEPEALARARTRLAEAWEEGERPQLRALRNRWTVAGSDAQLRYGHDGRWWPYRKERGRWTPAGPADQDPATALAVVLLEDA